MNDLEELLRHELRARADAADEAASSRRLTPLLTGLEHQIRRTRLHHRLQAGALAAAAVAVAIVLPLALLSGGTTPSSTIGPGSTSAASPGGTHPGTVGPSKPGHGSSAPVDRGIPLTRTSLTPSGWAPVSYLDAQLSVPSAWLVESSPGTSCGGSVQGLVYEGVPVDKAALAHMGCTTPPNIVSILPLSVGLSRSQPTGSHSTLNGFPVERVAAAAGTQTYLIPGFDVEVSASGPLAQQVLKTLTRSPLSVVLAPGPSLAAGSGWTSEDFGGIRFEVPGWWKTQQTSSWGGCPYGITANTVTLSTATVMSDPACPAPPRTTGFQQGRPGVVVGAGKYTAAAASGAHLQCMNLHGMRACVTVGGLGSALLKLAVYPPGQSQPILVEIGLAGSGAVARAVYDSIRPASGS
jgi:hypothetical protein